MYVCICKKITDTQIIREIELGATTVNDVSQRLGTSSQCGKCKKCVRNIVRKQRKEMKHCGYNDVLSLA